MKIAGDKNQFAGAHGKSNARKHRDIQSLGHELIQLPLACGDYILVDDKVQEVIDRKQKRGIEIKKMDLLGTYTVSVDSKKDLSEIAMNICGSQHGRFRDELLLAQNNGIKLIILIENDDGVKCVNDVFKWVNPRLKRYKLIESYHKKGMWMHVSLPKKQPTEGKTLARSMITCQNKYGCQFLFCKPSEAGAKIIELLEGKE